MIYYAPTIFGQLGLDGNTTSLLATGVYGIVNCLATLPALFFIDKVGRRVLLMAGATGTCISLVIVGGILGGYGASLMSHKSAGWAGIAFIYIYDINFSYSFGKALNLLCGRRETYYSSKLQLVGSCLRRSSICRFGPKPSLSRRRRRGCAICESAPSNLRESFSYIFLVSSVSLPQTCWKPSHGAPTSSSRHFVCWRWHSLSSLFPKREEK